MAFGFGVWVRIRIRRLGSAFGFGFGFGVWVCIRIRIRVRRLRSCFDVAVQPGLRSGTLLLLRSVLAVWRWWWALDEGVFGLRRRLCNLAGARHPTLPAARVCQGLAFCGGLLWLAGVRGPGVCRGCGLRAWRCSQVLRRFVRRLWLAEARRCLQVLRRFVRSGSAGC